MKRRFAVPAFTDAEIEARVENGDPVLEPRRFRNGRYGSNGDIGGRPRYGTFAP